MGLLLFRITNKAGILAGMNFKLTRLAPTPSGFIHLGNIYSFLLTKVLAEKTGARVLLRIDDLDRDRLRPAYVSDIFDTLDFMEIGYDVGPKDPIEFEREWSQLHRMSGYREAVALLKEKQLLFACDCSRKKIQQLDSSGNYLGYCVDRRIPLDKKDTCLRFDTLEAGFIELKDLHGKAASFVLPPETSFFMVRKKDGDPAYQLTSLLDDLHFGVDLIVRGSDLFGSSLAQQLVADAIGQDAFKATCFHHHAVLKGPDKKKLSKTEGATSIQFLRKSGKTPTDIYRMIGEMMGAAEPVLDFEAFRELTLPNLLGIHA